MHDCACEWLCTACAIRFRNEALHTIINHRWGEHRAVTFSKQSTEEQTRDRSRGAILHDAAVILDNEAHVLVFEVRLCSKIMIVQVVTG